MDDRIRKFVAEAAIGLLIAVMLFIVAATSVVPVHFVYQGF